MRSFMFMWFTPLPFEDHVTSSPNRRHHHPRHFKGVMKIHPVAIGSYVVIPSTMSYHWGQSLPSLPALGRIGRSIQARRQLHSSFLRSNGCLDHSQDKRIVTQ